MEISNFQTLLIGDLGQNKVTIFNAFEDSFETVSAIDFFDWLEKYSNSNAGGVLFVGESSHFGTPRSEDDAKLSKAQYWKSVELLNWYSQMRNCGVTLRFYPQKKTETIRRLLGMEKGDVNDCKAIYHDLTNRPWVLDSLQKPKSSFKSPLRIESLILKSDMDSTKNFMRNHDYRHVEDEITEFVRANLKDIAEGLSDEAKDAFCLTNEKKFFTGGKGVNAGFFNEPKYKQITAIACCLLNKDGSLRIRPSTGDIAGWKYTKSYLLRLHAMHQRGGVCRSDLMWHGCKHYIIAKLNNKVVKEGNKNPSAKPLADYSPQEWEQFYKYRNLYTKCIKEVFVSIKRVIREKYSPVTSEICLDKQV